MPRIVNKTTFQKLTHLLVFDVKAELDSRNVEPIHANFASPAETGATAQSNGTLGGATRIVSATSSGKGLTPSRYSLNLSSYPCRSSFTVEAPLRQPMKALRIITAMIH
jgi:hypothetical protein